MKERENAGANENPGPGTYAQEKVKVVGDMKDMMSNSFSTKVRQNQSSLTEIHNIFFFTDSSFLPHGPRLQQLQASFLLDKSWPRNSLQIA